MYKIMLVEDEPEVLSAMVRTLPWGEHGFHTPEACADGRGAIAKLDAGFCPDAVITDICMPFVDGIALSEAIRRKCPAALIVMLTGYGDFSYAQKAIKLQVYDYVLKPVTPKQMKALMDRMKAELDARAVHRLDEIAAISRRRFLTDLLTKDLDEKTIADNLRVQQLPLRGRVFLAAAADLVLPGDDTPAQSRDNALMRYGLCNMAEELAAQEPESAVYADVNGSPALIFFAETEPALYQAAEALAEKIAAAAKSSLNLSAFTGIGGAVTGVGRLQTSYRQGLQALRFRFFSGERPYFRSRDLVIGPRQGYDFSADEEDFLQAAGSMDEAAALLAVKHLAAHMQEQRVPYDRCLRFSQKIAVRLLNALDPYMDADAVKGLERDWENTDFSAVATLGQLMQLLADFCRKAFRRCGLSPDSVSSLIGRIETYLNEHYMDPELSVQSVTERFGISVSYFSALFKEKTGRTFTEYLTQVRVSQAQLILARTERRSSEAAEMVGFTDPHYFSLLFKRTTGLTPREYRAKARGGTPEEAEEKP